eukprot:TRINITY_DN3034_c0_g3_i1.p1 TRINITY_DN3034_c0_g3~~TRINITY_DN3034_c0_g3_i1.p1  ORF type:complete len:111 (+),score=38.89 TRINITY_DN3034_c0_g3_i1:141-473(+)
MKAVKFALAMALALAPAAALTTAGRAGEGEEESPCDAQCRFNIMMCESFMCTKCTYEWCTESCQKVQKDFPGLRCKDWPEARKSYSNGEFMGKGKLGDGGDYAQKKEEEE